MIMRSRSAPLFCLPVLISLALQLHSIWGTEIIEQDQSITNPNTIISSDGKFELGFFSPGNSSDTNTENYYLGIWHKVSKQPIIWVANREYALRSGSCYVAINSEGKLVISEGQMFYVVTNFTTSRDHETFAILLDSGNLVLQDKSSLEILWQSFDYPTDTILPGMNLGRDTLFGNYLSLVSWTSPEDPTPGSFSLEYSNYSLVVWKGSKTYWSGSLSEFEINIFYDKESEPSYFTWGSLDSSKIMHLVLDVFGQVKLESWFTDDKTWHTLNSSKCPYRRCGPFSVCNIISDKPCSCLRGFKPLSANFRTKNDISQSQGCVRKTELQCKMNSTGGGGFLQNDGFYWMKFVEYPSGKSLLKQIGSAAACEASCLSNCSCLAYTYDHELGFGCLQWYRNLFDLKQLAINSTDGKNFYLKLPYSELKTQDPVSPGNDHKNTGNNKMQLWTIAILTVSLSLLILGLFVYYVRNKLQRRGEDLLKFDLAMSLKAENTELAEANMHPAHRKPEVKLALFSFASVSAATNDFSPSNKLGEGGFGPVYKGVLLKGYEVAVKRLSKGSGQGWEELKNEASLIAKLQHRNLVRLLGCCIEKDEKILIYEYMPNKSLDFFLFDSAKRKMLDWETRVCIVEGIAQGLLYLHQYSRLRIIHRDLKASNILLDNNMNPKISDFGMARIFGGDELQANTNRIVGTYGYMPPEYALEGLFSIKSDVFSFGVLLLEIVSGKKNTGFYQSDSLYLLGHAWDLWIGDRGLELIDGELEEVSTHLAMRYVNIGLLCVQESANDRPTMSDVVSMLNNQSMVLLSPKQPAFLNVRSMVNAKQPHLVHSRPEACSVNGITFSVFDFEPR